MSTSPVSRMFVLTLVAGPLPSFDGSAPSAPSAPVSAPASAPVAAPQQQPSPTQIPLISPSDRANYAQLFARNAPSGLLDGNDARNIFLKAGLPNETLVQIWNLTDTQNRGQLDQGEFILAMHLIRSIIARTLRQLPSVLPPNALESVKTGSRAPSAGRAASISSNSGAANRYNQFPSANSPGPRASPVARQYTGPLQHPQLKTAQQAEWYITPQDQAKFDNIFNSLDKKHQGVIGAEEVVPFLTTSNLAEETLAQVWDLADVHNTGQFGKSEFAIAMYLVQQQLAGKTLPITLPSSLYPGGSNPASPGVGGSFSQPQRQVPQQTAAPKPAAANSSLNDLLSLGDSLSTPSPKPASALPTVSENRTGPVPSTIGTTNHLSQSLTGVRAPFVPTSSFGQTAFADKESNTPQFSSSRAPAPDSASTAAPVFSQPAATQSNFTGSAPACQQPLQTNDLFDPEYANKLSTLSTDNANLTNQVNSMSTQTDQARQKRERAEAELNRVLELKSTLETRLATLRAEYDAEVKRSNQAEQLLHQSQTETDKLSSEFSVLEASYHAVQSQHQEISAQLTYDQQENANLKEKIRFVNEETTNLKATLEKVQKEAKQQRNLVNITRKQLSFAEGERDKVQGQIQEASQPVVESRNVASTSSPGIGSIAAGASIGAVAGLATGIAATGISSPTPSNGIPSTTNPFYSSFSQPQPIPFSDNTPTFSSGFEDRFNHLDIASPSTAEPARSSTLNTVDTPNSSPPNSEYQYNPGNAPIPTFTLPLDRPESVTSSVQNNPPMSVRDDIDMSRPDSPEFPVTSEPVSGIVPPEDLVIRSVGGNFDGPVNYSMSQGSVPTDHEQPRQPSVDTVTFPPSESSLTSTQPFGAAPQQLDRPPTFTDSAFSPSSESIQTATHTNITPVSQSASTISFPTDNNTAAIQPATTQNTGSTIEGPSERAAASDANDHKDANSEFDAAFKSLNAGNARSGSNPWPSASKGEFPPIQELDYDESSSDDEKTPQTSASQPSQPVSANFVNSASTDASNDMFVTATSSPSDLGLTTSSLPSNQPSVTSPSVSNPMGTFGGAPAFSPDTHSAAAIPPQVPSKDADPFDAAFDGLTVADEEKEEVSLNFGAPTSFNFDNSAPAPSPFAAQPNAFTPAAGPAPVAAAPGKSGFDIFPSDNGPVDAGAPVSNEEWDSIFAGFGAPSNGGSAPQNSASQSDISNAFEKPQAQTPADVPAEALTPQSAALNELVGMGFKRELALDALKKNNYNVETAGNYLLDH